jgi:phosphoribosylformylglycinamidine (FGAM) synthase PurS component
MTTTRTISVLILLFAIAFLILRSRPRQREFKTTNELIEYLSGQAVEDARDNNRIELDYSVESIKQVEEILGKVHEQYLNNPASVSERGLGSEYGAYLGECIRRSEPGAYWERDHPVGGEKSYREGESFPMAWCRRRIIEGDGNNVWFKYTVLKEQRMRKEQLHNAH